MSSRRQTIMRRPRGTHRCMRDNADLQHVEVISRSRRDEDDINEQVAIELALESSRNDTGSDRAEALAREASENDQAVQQALELSERDQDERAAFESALDEVKRVSLQEHQEADCLATAQIVAQAESLQTYEDELDRRNRLWEQQLLSETSFQSYSPIPGREPYVNDLDEGYGSGMSRNGSETSQLIRPARYNTTPHILPDTYLASTAARTLADASITSTCGTPNASPHHSSHNVSGAPVPMTMQLRAERNNDTLELPVASGHHKSSKSLPTPAASSRAWAPLMPSSPRVVHCERYQYGNNYYLIMNNNDGDGSDRTMSHAKLAANEDSVPNQPLSSSHYRDVTQQPSAHLQGSELSRPVMSKSFSGRMRHPPSSALNERFGFVIPTHNEPLYVPRTPSAFSERTFHTPPTSRVGELPGTMMDDHTRTNRSVLVERLEREALRFPVAPGAYAETLASRSTSPSITRHNPDSTSPIMPVSSIAPPRPPKIPIFASDQLNISQLQVPGGFPASDLPSYADPSEPGHLYASVLPRGIYRHTLPSPTSSISRTSMSVHSPTPQRLRAEVGRNFPYRPIDTSLSLVPGSDQNIAAMGNHAMRDLDRYGSGADRSTNVTVSPNLPQDQARHDMEWRKQELEAMRFKNREAKTGRRDEVRIVISRET